MLKPILLSILLGLSAVKSEEAVFTLTQDNFDEFIAEHPKALVEFYAPWCGHCKSLAPEYEKAAQQLASDGIGAVLAKVDATVEKDLASKFGVRGFPTLKYFTGDVDAPSDYSGGRTADTIVSWLSVRALPAVSELSSTEDVETFKKKGKVTIVAFLNDESKQAILTNVADANRDSTLIGLVTDESVAKSLSTELNKVLLYTAWEDEAISFDVDDSFSEEELTEFIMSERFPLIDAIGPENYKQYVDRGLPIVWISVDVSDDEQLANTITALTPHAKDFKGKLSFVYVDNVKYAQHVQNLGITGTPGILIAAEAKKYRYEDDLFDSNTLSTFFTNYGDGKLVPYMKTEPVPETNDDAVYVLVGSEFENVVGKDKDVFVEYYAPWCGHCKRLAPEYEKVGEAFQDVEGIIVAKMDSTANDSPEEIKGFPTLIFYKKGSTTGVKYNGDREAPAIIQYIKEQATVDVSSLKEDL